MASVPGSDSLHPFVRDVMRRFGYVVADEPPSRLSHNRRQIDPTTVDSSQRWRLLLATAKVIASQGYANATIDKITKAAGVSKVTFYKFYASKEEAFLGCYTGVEGWVESLLPPQGDDDRPFTQAIDDAIEIYLTALSAVPDLTRMFLVEAIGASPAIRRQRLADIDQTAEALLQRLAALRHRGETAPELTRTELVMLLGGINELCVQHLHRAEADTLTTLIPTVQRFVHKVMV